MILNTFLSLKNCKNILFESDNFHPKRAILLYFCPDYIENIFKKKCVKPNSFYARLNLIVFLKYKIYTMPYFILNIDIRLTIRGINHFV